MRRILWVSDHPLATSGYSIQTRITVPRLAQAGLAQLAVLATFGQHGYTTDWDGIPIYPGGSDPFANDVIARTARHVAADLVITLKDVPVFAPDALRGLRWCPLTPIDHEPAPPAVVERARLAYQPLAYAPNGVRALAAAGLDPAYVPHAYDPAWYAPGDRAAARAALGLPLEAFVLGTVAVNRGGLPSRKAWPQLIDAVARASARIPGLLWLCHTDRAADGHEQGVPLDQLAAMAGIHDRMLLPPSDVYRAGLGVSHLNTIYQACDVVLAVSLGEGFGLPALEAQACGIPVIVSGWCAHEDLCFAGWQVTRDEATSYLDPQLARVWLPDPDAIADRILQAYTALVHEDQRAALAQQAIDGAAPYQIDAVIDRAWRPLLAELDARITREARTSRGVIRVILPREVLP